MTRGMKWTVAAVALATLVGCGSDPGSGTGTLYVDAIAESDGSGNGTYFFFEVRQGSSNGDIVQDATVVVTGDKGTEHQLNLFSILGVPLGYTKNNLAWEPGWRIRIDRGTDHLEAYLQAPGLTTITAPVGGTLYQRSSGDPLIIKWRDESGRRADNVVVDADTGNYDNQLRAEDPLQREIPSSAWTEPDAEERIRVERYNEINLEGGVSGSKFRALTTAEVTIQVQ